MLPVRSVVWRRAAALLLVAAALGSPGCKVEDPPESLEDRCAPEGEPAQRTDTGQWQSVEIAGAVCADGSPYRVFVKYAERSHDLVVTFQGGGACWDYATCTGDAGLRGASNLDGVDEDHMTALPPPFGDDPDATPWGILHPHLGRSDPRAPTADYHQVFLPYCTGDVFAGDVTGSYTSADGLDTVTIEHRGRANVKAVLPWLVEEFPEVGRLLVTGCSAGGVGSLINYAAIRDALEPRCAHGLDDSGPLLSESGFSSRMLATIREAWSLDGLLEELDRDLAAPDGEGTQADMANLLPMLSAAYPDDRFLLTLFGRDLNFSLFSYQLFYDDPSDEEVYAMWDADVLALREVVERLDNVGYFMPAFRPDNCSHCLSLIPVDQLESDEYTQELLLGSADTYLGTEVATDEGDVRFDDALALLLSDEPLPELVETPGADDALDAAGSLECR